MLEDGRIIEHDDPHIIVDTVEDTQTHEFDHLDDKELSTQLQASIERSYRRAGIDVNEVDLAGGKQKRPQSRPRKSLAYHDGHPSHLISSTSAADVVKAHNFDDDNHDIVGDTFKRVVNTHDVRGETKFPSLFNCAWVVASLPNLAQVRQVSSTNAQCLNSLF